MARSTLHDWASALRTILAETRDPLGVVSLTPALTRELITTLEDASTKLDSTLKTA